MSADRDLMRRVRRLTPPQRAAFDRICVNDDSRMHPQTAAALIKRGLVRGFVERRGIILIRRYDVASLEVHRAWCQVCAEDTPEEPSP